MEIYHFDFKKKKVQWYYNIGTRNDIFENGIDNNLKEFSYSPIKLYFLLKEINNHEPALVNLIISFMCIKDSIYYWAKFFYNITLSKEDILLIKSIYPVKKDNMTYSISVIDNYLKNQKYSSLFKTIIKDMQVNLIKKNKCNYYTYPKDLIKTIGLFNIIKYNTEITRTKTLYDKIYDKSKDHFYRHQVIPLNHLHIAIENIKECQEIYKQYIKLICKKMKQCYTLGD